MVWASIGYNGNTEIKFISGKRNSKNYLDLIKDQLDNYALHISDTGFIFQQDNAAIHNSKLVQTYFYKERISVLPWPARSPDLNIIENCWSVLSQAIYKDGKQYESNEELKKGIIKEWDNLNEEIIKNL